MDNYLLLKLIHIISATVLAGTGMGTAFFMFMANRSQDIPTIAVTARHVVIADWIFTTPAVIIQFTTGLLLMNRLGYSYSSTWFLSVLFLFIFIGICWLPVVYIQYKLKDAAYQALKSGSLSDQFRRLMRVWTILGVPAFCAILVIFWLMVYKPLPVI